MNQSLTLEIRQVRGRRSGKPRMTLLAIEPATNAVVARKTLPQSTTPVQSATAAIAFIDHYRIVVNERSIVVRCESVFL